MLESLKICGGTVSDACLAHLARIPRLKDLTLERTRVTAAGLRRIGDLNRTVTLHLGFSRMTDPGLEPLAGVLNLRSLSLSGTTVTNRGMAALKEAPTTW
ncbi:MAG: hypothetical protein J0M04_13915 [Verrucomicrobia bacterium]|nr:hypothetical protein [Verrucomicrobiota bacterium]